MSVAYKCFLDDDRAAVRLWSTELSVLSHDLSSLIVSLGATIQSAPLADDSVLADALLTVTDPVTGVKYPYWVANPSRYDIIASLIGGGVRPADLPSEIVTTLLHTGILVAPSAEVRAKATWEEAVVQASRQLDTQRYAVLRAIFNPLHLTALQHYAHVADQRGLLMPDPSPRRFKGRMLRRVCCGDRVIQYFHEQFSPFAQRIVGRPLARTYACIFHYPPGSWLPPHRDFSHCQLAMSITLQKSARASQFQFQLENDGEPIAVSMEAGDGVIYYGEELLHFREPFGPHESTTTLVFCFAARSEFTSTLS